MKLVTLSGGLGNQMFQYAFYLSLKMHDEKVYLYKNKILSNADHNGYELERLFRVEEVYRGKWITNLLVKKGIGNIMKHILFPVKVRERRIHDFSIYGDWINRTPCYGVHLVGYWQSERYFEGVLDAVRNSFTFDKQMFNERTKSCFEKMCSENAVSLHVRRGDYLLAENVRTLGNICDKRYYQRAVGIINKKVNNPVFYVFSDDIKWTIENVPLPENTIFVDWNRGQDSWQDMFLMSSCKHNIIANSSFSWWGAWLNSNENKLVIAPALWIRNTPAPDVAPRSWVRI